MRSFIVMAMFTMSLANAAWNGYEEARELELDSEGIEALSITAGAGSLEITGVAGTGEIRVEALIQVPDRNDDKAQKVIESDLILTLEKSGRNAVLRAYFDRGMWNFGDSPSVRLVVTMPQDLGLEVDDGSGSMVISDVSGDIEVDDGSGSISMSNVGGEVRIDDGSGSISVEQVGGDISIVDGSGSIKVREVLGSVVVDDGSGSITVNDVEHDLIIEDDGSGGLNFSNIKGRVEKEG